MSDPVMLVDLSALFAASWYATVDQGDPTLARAATVETIEKECAGRVAIICLDSPTSFRAEISPEYKANRPQKPPEFIREMRATQGELAARGYQLASADGFEADDVIATLAARLTAAGRRVCVASGDKDLMQLVSDNVSMLSTRDGKTIGTEQVFEKFGVRPDQVLDYLCLVGDASDNVAGVPGIGPKRAAQLLQTFGTIDAMFAAIRAGRVLLSERLTKTLAESWDVIELARKLVTLRTDAPVTFVGDAPEDSKQSEPATVAAPEPTAKEERSVMALPAQKQAAPTATGRLGAVKRGKIAAAWKFVFYGDAGVGKTTLAAGAPDPIWVDIESSSIHVDVPRYPFSDGPMGHVPTDFDQVLAAIDDIATSRHDYKTVVMDGIDKLEGLVWSKVVTEANNSNIKTIEDFGFGKGLVAAFDVWRELLRRLDAFRARGINAILIAHADIKTFKSPNSDDYDQWQLRLDRRAAGALKDWADVVGFVGFDEWARKEKGAMRAKGYGSGRRMLYTEKTPAYYAKTRLPLAKEIEIDIANPWGPIEAAIRAVADANPSDLLKAIDAELARLGDDELTAKVRGACEPVKTDVPALSRYLHKLQGMQPKNTETTQAA